MVSRKIRLCQTTSILCWGLFVVSNQTAAETRRVSDRRPAEAVAARVVSVNGRVRAGSRQLKPGDSLMAGEIVRAEDDSGAKLMLADNSILDVGASSSLKIESFVPNSGPDREVVVGVESGKVRASIKKKIEGRGKFLIRTRASVLAVRGTELVVDVGTSPGSRESVFVKEGNVLAEFAGGGGKVVIPEGRRLDAQTSGGGFSVRPSDFKVGAVDKTEMTGAFNRATIVDRSFLQNIQIRENDDLFRGRATVQTLAMNFKAPPPLPPGWRPDAGQLIKDQAPPKLDHPGSLRRNGADQQIDIGGNNVTEVNVSVIFKP